MRVKFAAHLSSREAQLLMVSLSNHAAISSPATPKIPFILSIDVKTRPFPLSLDGRGVGVRVKFAAPLSSREAPTPTCHCEKRSCSW